MKTTVVLVSNERTPGRWVRAVAKINSDGEPVLDWFKSERDAYKNADQFSFPSPELAVICEKFDLTPMNGDLEVYPLRNSRSNKNDPENQ